MNCQLASHDLIFAFVSLSKLVEIKGLPNICFDGIRVKVKVEYYVGLLNLNSCYSTDCHSRSTYCTLLLHTYCFIVFIYQIPMSIPQTSYSYLHTTNSIPYVDYSKCPGLVSYNSYHLNHGPVFIMFTETSKYNYKPYLCSIILIGWF